MNRWYCVNVSIKLFFSEFFICNRKSKIEFKRQPSHSLQHLLCWSWWIWIFIAHFGVDLEIVTILDERNYIHWKSSISAFHYSCSSVLFIFSFSSSKQWWSSTKKYSLYVSRMVFIYDSEFHHFMGIINVQ